jgi:predicted O-methyltransferase YrrM
MITWESDKRLVVGETSFELAVFLKGFTGKADFALQKPRQMVECYLALRDEFHEANVVELGIFRGGSVALLAETLSPNKMVSIDIETERVSRLDEFISTRGLTETIVQHYGVDQSDTAALDKIVARHFGDASLDLVIDDASHDRDLTLASFNALF